MSKNKIVQTPGHAAARSAGLKYVSDSEPGIRRVKISNGFAYVGTNGRRIGDAKILFRVNSLVIPPAWTDVWICTDPDGHIQAVGRDARKRKQYRYHPRWRETRDETKYSNMIAFAKSLPRIRGTVRRHLRGTELTKQKVLAAIIAIMEKTLIRVGNDEYASHNDSYGLTTMRDGHAKVNGKHVRFQFRGKSGVEHEIDLDDEKLTKIVRRCRDLPGQQLFQYLNGGGTVRDITSNDVNDYLREISGGDFTAKDFRTWAGTVLAARALREVEIFNSQSQARKNLVQAVEKVARQLGNTRAVCRKCYIHPAIIESYLDGSFIRHIDRKPGKMPTESAERLSTEETAVLMLIRGHAEMKVAPSV